MPDFGQCGDPSCNETAVRLFDCAHHCMKMVCLQHLIEHDRLIENNKRQLDIVQNELKRLHLIYSSLIDEHKIRSEYERKLEDYKKLVHEMNCLLENHTNDIEKVRVFIEKLKKLIHEKQKQLGESLTIVKVEPSEEISSSMTNSQKDDSLFIGFDRLQNLIIDTDYHKRKATENALVKNESNNKTIIAIDDGDYKIYPNIHRIAGQCPFWINGSYGLNEESHSHRLCRKKYFTDLSNHIRQYHGILTPIANIIARAVHSKVPVTKCLIPNDLQVTDPRRCFFCPFRSECQYQHWLAALSLRGHLIDVHHMDQSMAEIKVKKIKKLNKNKPMSKIKDKVFDVIKKIESRSKEWMAYVRQNRSLDFSDMPQTGYCTDVTCNKELTELYECHCCSWLICLKHLLEHVEIAKRDKKEQLNSLRNELVSVSYTLELIVEKKLHEIEREKELISQAKIIIDKSGHTIEEIQLISEEINQAILSNRKEETIVKVESSLLDIQTNACTNESITDKLTMANLFASSSSSNCILQQPKSPIYRGLKIYPNRFETSSTPKSNDQSTKFDDDFTISSMDDEMMVSTKDEADDEGYEKENVTKHNDFCEQCPLIFDGAFGLSKAKHSIEICSIENSRRRNLIGHLMNKHKFKKIHAYRLYKAVKTGQNPKITKLFHENEDVIDHDRDIPCPFTSNMINLVGCCPTQSRRIPCQSKPLATYRLVAHLRRTHGVTIGVAKSIVENYREKLSKRISSNGNDTPPRGMI